MIIIGKLVLINSLFSLLKDCVVSENKIHVFVFVSKLIKYFVIQKGCCKKPMHVFFYCYNSEMETLTALITRSNALEALLSLSSRVAVYAFLMCMI